MPTIITRGTASAQAFGFNNVALGGPYWMTRVFSTDGIDLPSYTTGIQKTPSGNYLTLNNFQVVFSSTGVVTPSNFRFTYNNSGADTLSALGGIVFSDGSSMCITQGTTSGNGNTGILKQASGGTPEFGRRISASGSATFRVATKSSDDKFIGLSSLVGGGIVFYKYSSDGTLDGAQSGTATGSLSGSKIVLNPATGDYVAGASNGLFALTSNGGFNWAKTLGYSYTVGSSDICCDNAGYSYIVNTDNPATTCYVMKFDSFGSLIFTKSFPFTGNSSFLACACDSSNNLYIGSGSSFIKLDSSLSVIYTKSISVTSTTTYTVSINIYPTGMVIAATRQNAPICMFVYNLPIDGSKTGTYTLGSNTVVYSTISNPTVSTASAPSVTVRTWSMSSYTPAATAVSLSQAFYGATSNTVPLT
jgi:hypothetical protein